tara:strand:- start:398 stop:1417 length:1020 start_codon:yes stop_codon:yes gene_type:complete
LKILSLFTKILHYLPGEISHNLGLKSLKILDTIGLLRLVVNTEDFSKSSELNDKRINSFFKIKNRLGIAAGLDKNGEYISCLAALGVGFIELGTVTPLPQDGNRKPRLFRNRLEKSLLNRLGFNNKGVDYLVDRLRKNTSNVTLGISIGKNFDTPNESAHLDYEICMKKVYEYSDYIAVNISSPNTEGLRELSGRSYLDFLLKNLKTLQSQLSEEHGYKPLFLKISPDESNENLNYICESVLRHDIDGIICTNTTINHKDAQGKGGLSGKPLKEISTLKLKFVKNIVGNEVPIIASGGVMSQVDYEEKISSGASLVQVYTGLIFEGPQLISNILNSKST